MNPKNSIKENSSVQTQMNWTKEIVEGIPDPVIIINNKSEIIMVNARTETKFGYSREELHGQFIEILIPKRLHTVHIGHRDQYHKNPSIRAMGEGMDLRACHKDGSEFPVEVSLSPLVTSEGTLILSTVRDITDRKKDEQKIQLQMSQAKDLVSELKQTNQELEQFAYIASHDLKAPLRGIDNLAQWIEEDLQGTLVGETKEHMKLLRQRIARLEALLNDLLDYSKAGKEKEITLVDSKKMITDLVDLFENQDRDLNVKIHDDLPKFAAQKSSLELVFRNLINNAIKHHDRTVINLEISVKEHNEFYKFSVKDDGPGIAPEYHERIFDMFKTLKSRDEVEGSGMGLSIIKKLVTGQGGNIQVESPANTRGTNFIFDWKKINTTEEQNNE